MLTFDGGGSHGEGRPDGTYCSGTPALRVMSIRACMLFDQNLGAALVQRRARCARKAGRGTRAQQIRGGVTRQQSVRRRVGESGERLTVREARNCAPRSAPRSSPPSLFDEEARWRCGIGVHPACATPADNPRGLLPARTTCAHMSAATGALHCLLLAALEAGILGLRIVSLDVPQRVSVGREALLKCAYDLEGDLLYSVKWYKDDIEFFRYVPSDRPPGQYFEVNGIRVDMLRSVNGSVFIRGMDAASEGTYKCEVSADAPSFQTIFAEKMIRVDSGSSSQLRTSGVAWALVATIGCLTSLLRWHAT
ncbi:hypothetical protein MRX96_023353 [Rhipicephalus microplus]